MFNHFKTIPGFASGFVVLSLFDAVSAVSQTTNEWTKPTSGYWEESYWSLGRLPLQQDTVAFRNPNWKALAIGANTTANYPGSLSVSNLLIQAPTYSFNQLLLNWAGLAVPLAVRSNLIIGVNGSLASHHSSLRAAYFEVNGPTTFSDGAVAAFNQIVVGHVAAAELALENGSISCGRFMLGFGAPGTYTQTGGTLNTTNIEIGGSASFNLAGGAVSNAGLFTIRGPSSVFVAAATTQRLGKLQITNTPASASMDLQAGTNNAGAALLRFRDSRDIGWSGTLRILNFSTNHPGYGPDHIFVGTNSQGLTSGQLSRVTFVRPDGSPSNYLAAIMPSGEVVPAVAQGQDFRYTTNNGTITITGYTGPGGDVIIPSTITGLPVTTIGVEAFEDIPSLTSVTLPNSVTNIGIFAFAYCTSLTTITVDPGNSLYSSVAGVLFNKSQTTLISFPGGKAGNYTIPNTVTTIGAYAFESCTSIGSVAIPDSVTTIGIQAFSYCPSLTSIIIGNRVTLIPQSAFSGCSSLRSVTIPNSVTTIEFDAFSYCTSLTNAVVGNGVTTIGSDAFYNCNSLMSVSIGNSVTIIGSDAFSSCSNLISISIPNSVTTLGNNTFSQCTSLTTVVLGGGLTNIAQGTFSYCASLTSITIPDSVVSIGVLAFAFCPSLTNAVIGNGVTSIGADAFYICTGLISVTIPSSVTTIGDSAFDYCTSLTGVMIPNSVTSIGSWAFDRCTNLTSVAIPDSVTGIGSYAFFGCNGLLSVTIPKSVVAIGDAAFSACRGLSAITVAPDNPFYSSLDGVLFNKSRTTLISFPGAKAGTYTIPNSVTNIGDAAFFDCASLTSITIPNSVTSIGSEAFSDCTGLLGITLPNSILAIADAAFSGCTNLTNVTIPNSVTSVGSEVFFGCTSLTNVTLGSSVNDIARLAFFNCASLMTITVNPGNSFYSSLDGVLFNKAQTMLVLCPQGKAGSYIIPNGVTTIADGAFYYCASLTGITFPNNLTNIENDAFSSCTNLASVTIPNSVTTLGDFAFQNCTRLTTVIIGDGVTSIYGAFAGCISLTEVTLPNSITTIGNEAFSDCTSLTSIAIPSSVTTIGIGAFFDCPGLTNVTIPNSVISIGDLAFGFCTNLTALYFAGNAPNVEQEDVFPYAFPTIYYLPGTTGWAPTFAGRPTALWLPKVDANPETFGVHTDRFGFIISWAGERTVIVEARTNLAKGAWIPLSTNTLTDGSFYFSDPQWTNYPSRFYRLHAP
jgi:hypothetical protein